MFFYTKKILILYYIYINVYTIYINILDKLCLFKVKKSKKIFDFYLKKL